MSIKELLKELVKAVSRMISNKVKKFWRKIRKVPLKNWLEIIVALVILFILLTNKINPPLEALIGMSAALIALLIPLSLFLLEGTSHLSWDNRVIIEEVLQIKSLFIALLLMVFPLVFWNLSGLRGVIFILCLIGYVGTVLAMSRAYQWMMSRSTESYSWIGELEKLTYRNQMRSKYLDTLMSDDEILEVWGTIFQTEGWIGLDSKLFAEKYVEALQQVEENADEEAENLETETDDNFKLYSHEQTLMTYLINSLEGKYSGSHYNFESLQSFAPLQKFVVEKYVETIDSPARNLNVRFLLDYLMKFVNHHEFLGFGGEDSKVAPSFYQDFYEMLRNLQRKDEESPRRSGQLSRVSETVSYFLKDVSGQEFVEVLELIMRTQENDSENAAAFWQNYLENPEYELMDVQADGRNITAIFDLLKLTYPDFFSLAAFDDYKNALDKLYIERNTKAGIRKARTLEILDELIKWQKSRVNNIAEM